MCVLNLLGAEPLQRICMVVQLDTAVLITWKQSPTKAMEETQGNDTE